MAGTPSLERITVTSKRVDVGERTLDLVTLTAAQHKLLFAHLNKIDVADVGDAIAAAFSAGDLLGSDDSGDAFSKIVQRAYKAFTGAMATGAFDILIDMAAICLDNRKNFKALCEGNQAEIKDAEQDDIGLTFKFPIYAGSEDVRAWIRHFVLPQQAYAVVKEVVTQNGYDRMGKDLVEMVKRKGAEAAASMEDEATAPTPPLPKPTLVPPDLG